MSSSTSDAGTLTPRIPSLPKIDDFHTNLSLMKQQGHTNIELLDWLKQYGITTSSVTLERRLRKYPVTLLWYPKLQDPDSFIISSNSYAFCDASLLPARGSSPTFTELSSLPEPLDSITAVGPTAVPAPAPLAPTKSRPKAGKGTPQASDFRGHS